MFNLITINLNYSCSYMYPVNVFQTSIKNFIVLIQGNWTIKKCFKIQLNNKLDMFPGTWGCPRHVRFACHTSSMHIQSTKAMYLQIHSK